MGTTGVRTWLSLRAAALAAAATLVPAATAVGLAGAPPASAASTPQQADMAELQERHCQRAVPRAHRRAAQSHPRGHDVPGLGQRRMVLVRGQRDDQQRQPGQ